MSWTVDDKFEKQNAEGSAVLNIAINDLLDDGHLSHNLLRDILNTAYLQMLEEKLYSPLPQHFITKALSRIFNSHLRDEAINSSVKLYCDFLDDETSLLLLQYTMEALQSRSNELLSVNPEAYFRNAEININSDTEQVIYCLHVINSVNQIKKDNGDFLLFFLSWVTQPLFYMIQNFSRPVQRAAIWALYWVKEKEYSGSAIQKFEEDKFRLLLNHLSGDFDMASKFRICLTILRDVGLKIPNDSNHITLDLAMRMQKQLPPVKEFENTSQNLPFFIEETLINLFDISNSFWVEKFTIPLLSCNINHQKTLDRLLNIFHNNPKTRLRAAVVLYSLGKLTPSDFAIIQADSENLDQWIVSMSWHLIHQFKSDDSTGKMAYYCVLVQPENLELYKKFISGSGIINFVDVARLVAYSYGDEPSQELKKLLKDTYEFFI